MKVNFFWKGDNFDQFIQLCIKSHIKVGHEVVMWLSGDKPKSKFWFTKNITIKNADTIYDVTDFLLKGGNFPTASDMWRFHFLYEHGGWYCDTDMFALKHFSDDDWMICSGEEKEKNFLSISTIKVPPKQKFLLECIDHIEHTWGNVKLFSEAYKKQFGNTNPTHDNDLFYPWTWKEWDSLLLDETDISDCYAIHLWNVMLKRNNVKFEKTKQASILNYLIDFVK